MVSSEGDRNDFSMRIRAHSHSGLLGSQPIVDASESVFGRIFTLLIDKIEAFFVSKEFVTFQLPHA